MANKNEPLEMHEKECRLRYEHIQARLESGSARFDKLEKNAVGDLPLYSCLCRLF